ncbi:MAG: phosphopantothenoylcysteine decarboxylase [Phycisphaerae bacterium]|nr:phosphopantothenoylcysteine decarboxylase [Phycisphaerae bacterium]
MSRKLRILITAGPTREPIDPVRFIGNRSSGKMGAALVTAAIEAGHEVTLIAGSMSAIVPPVRRIDVETAAEMQSAVLNEFPNHDLLIMSAAIADFRPIRTSQQKLGRDDSIIIECEPTEDIVASAAQIRRADQRIIAFSLESDGNVERARSKMTKKAVDLMVFNALSTMQSDTIRATMLSPTRSDESLPVLDKSSFARHLIKSAESLMD